MAGGGRVATIKGDDGGGGASSSSLQHPMVDEDFVCISPFNSS